MRVALLKVLLIVAIMTIPVCSRLLSNEEKEESDTGVGGENKVDEPIVEIPLGEKQAGGEAGIADPEVNKVHAAINAPVIIPATPVVDAPSKSRAGLYILVAVALLGVVAIGTTFVLGKQKN